MSTEFTIETASDLHRALLESGQPVQLAMLNAIAQRPAEACVYGRDPETGMDLIDVLLLLTSSTFADVVRVGATKALSKFDDPRVGLCFLRQFEAETDPTALQSYARWLHDSELEEVQQGLRRLLVEGTPDQVRALAFQVPPSLLQTQRQKLRFAMFRDFQPIDWILDTELWWEELQGPFSRETRSLLEELGSPAFAKVYARSSSLKPVDRLWLLAWGAKLGRPEARELAHDMVDAFPLEVLRHAGNLLKPEQLKILAAHPDERVRVSAVSSGLPTDDWARSCREGAVAQRVAWIHRLPIEHQELLEALLDDDDWKVRAAARARMATQAG